VRRVDRRLFVKGNHKSIVLCVVLVVAVFYTRRASLTETCPLAWSELQTHTNSSHQRINNNNNNDQFTSDYNSEPSPSYQPDADEHLQDTGSSGVASRVRYGRRYDYNPSDSVVVVHHATGHVTERTHRTQDTVEPHSRRLQVDVTVTRTSAVSTAIRVCGSPSQLLLLMSTLVRITASVVSCLS